MEIKLTYEEFQGAHAQIETAYEDLMGIKAELTELSSQSEAMSEFYSRVKQLEKIITEYAGLLGDDCLALFEAGAAFVDLDSKEATKYRSGLYETRKLCPADSNGASHSGGGTSAGGSSSGGGGVRGDTYKHSVDGSSGGGGGGSC